MLPNFLGLGAPKAATTWLFHCLREHPQVFMAENKELMFFDYSSIDGSLPTYEQHFSGSSGARAVGEFCTRYFASKLAPARVKSLIPDAKLVVSLRCPTEQVYSHYWHLRRQNFHGLVGDVKPLAFEEALEAIPHKLLEPAYYHRHLSRWLSSFDQSRVHIIVFDDIVTNPRSVVRKLYEFLDVDADFLPTSIHRNDSTTRKGTVPRSSSMESIHRWIYTSLTKYVQLPLKSAIGVRRADRLRSLLRVREIMTRLFHITGYPEMCAATRSALQETFESDVRALSDLLGRSLNHWSSRSSNPPANQP